MPVGGGDSPGDGVGSGGRPRLQVLGDDVLGQPRLALLDLPGRSGDHDLGSCRDDRIIERQDHRPWWALHHLLVCRVGGCQGVVRKRLAGACPYREHCSSNHDQQPISDPRCMPGQWSSGHLVALRRGHTTMATRGAVRPMTAEEANPDHYSTLVSRVATSPAGRTELVGLAEDAGFEPARA